MCYVGTTKACFFFFGLLILTIERSSLSQPKGGEMDILIVVVFFAICFFAIRHLSVFALKKTAEKGRRHLLGFGHHHDHQSLVNFYSPPAFVLLVIGPISLIACLLSIGISLVLFLPAGIFLEIPLKKQ